MLKVFEMFSGYGGGSFSLKKANINHKVVGFSEINKDAIKCYFNNHNSVKNFGNCAKIKTDDAIYKLAGNGWDVNLVSQIFRNIFGKRYNG